MRCGLLGGRHEQELVSHSHAPMALLCSSLFSEPQAPLDRKKPCDWTTREEHTTFLIIMVALAHASFSFPCQHLTALVNWKFSFYHWKTSHTAISPNIFSFYLSNGQKELTFLLFLSSCILCISNVLSHLPSGLNKPIFLSFFLYKSCCLNLWLFITFFSLSKSFMKCLFNMGTVLHRCLLDAEQSGGMSFSLK